MYNFLECYFAFCVAKHSIQLSPLFPRAIAQALQFRHRSAWSQTWRACFILHLIYLPTESVTVFFPNLFGWGKKKILTKSEGFSRQPRKNKKWNLYFEEDLKFILLTFRKLLRLVFVHFLYFIYIEGLLEELWKNLREVVKFILVRSIEKSDHNFEQLCYCQVKTKERLLSVVQSAKRSQFAMFHVQ